MNNADAGGVEKSEKSILNGDGSMFGAYNAGVYPLVSEAGLNEGPCRFRHGPFFYSHSFAKPPSLVSL